MRFTLLPSLLLFASVACSGTDEAPEQREAADHDAPAAKEATGPDADPDGGPAIPTVPVAPVCKGDPGSPSHVFRNYPRFPPAVLRPLGDTKVGSLDKAPATLLGVRSLATPVQMECSDPFDATTSPCRVSTVVQLAIGDASMVEVLVSLPAPAIEALGHDVPVRVSTTVEPYADALSALVVFAADGNAPLFGLYDSTKLRRTEDVPPSAGPLSFTIGSLACAATIDMCQHRLGAFPLVVTAGSTKVDVPLEGTADVATASGTYRVWHRNAAVEIPSGSPYARCADLIPDKLSFEFVRLP